MGMENKYEHAYKRTPLQILYFNFVGGLSWGVGTVLGATVMVGLLGLFVSRSRNIPFVGEITNVFLQEIQRGQESFRDQFSPDDQPVSNTLPDSFTEEN